MNTLAECVKACGNASYGNVLYRILYWYPRAKFKRGDITYLVKTSEEISEDTGISVRTVKRAMNFLRDEGYIYTEIHPHPFRSGIMRSMHIQVTDRAKTILEPSKDPSCHHEQGQSGTFDSANMAPSYIQEDSNTTTIEEQEDLGLQPKPIANQPRKKKEVEDMGKVGDIIYMSKNFKFDIKDTDPPYKKLIAVWKNGLKAIDPDMFITMTNKDIAIIKGIITKGMPLVGDEKTVEAIDYTLQNWLSYQMWYKEQFNKPCANVPNLPMVSGMLGNILTFYKQTKDKKDVNLDDAMDW